MIKINNLHKKWDEFFLEVNLEVRKGEYFVLLGPTGSGKTLLLELIAGFHQPDSGEIWINERNVTSLPPERRGVGFVYQDYALFPHLTVKENIAFGLKLRKLPKHVVERETTTMMDLLGISHLQDRHPNTLSGGEKQKTAIGRAIVLKPDVLLLDEPLSALDARTKTEMQEELKKIHNEVGITVIHVTHDQSEARMIADRIGVMMDRRIVQVGAISEIFNKPLNEKIADFLGVENVLEGIITRIEEGLAIVDLGDIEISAVPESKLEVDQRVNVFIRPEAITLSKKAQRTSARNTIKGRINRIRDAGAVQRVKLDCGLVATTTKQSAEELGLRPHADIYATFKATAVHVVKM